MARIGFVLALCIMLGSCKDEPRMLVVHKPENTPKDTLSVAFLVMNGVYNTEFTAAYDIFHHTIFRDDVYPMKVFSISKDSHELTSFEGIRFTADYTIHEKHPEIDILAVPSAEHHLDSDLGDEKMIDWVSQTGKDAQYVISFCDGAFVLAQAGLLKGHLCTTFPGDIETMREMFPKEGVSWIHDETLITSVGGARSFDVALYLCEFLYGKKVAEEIAEGMVIDWNVGNHRFMSSWHINLPKNLEPI